MSKLTFRADEGLVERVEALDASKSEIMREALRAYLDSIDAPGAPGVEPAGTIDAVIEARVDALVEDHLASRERDERDVNVNITFEGMEAPARADVSDREPAGAGKASDQGGDRDEDGDLCAQCGEPVDSDHVYCPNCGEKRSRRVFCECGDEVRTDWSFCPSCGRRTPAADVLERS